VLRARGRAAAGRGAHGGRGLILRRRARRPDAPTYNRIPPEAFAAFGAGSAIHEPANVFNPDRVRIGAGVTILGGAWLSVITEHNGVRYEPRLTIGDGTTLGHQLLIACVQEVTIGARVLASDRVFIGDTSHGHAQPATAVIDQPMTPPRPVRIGAGAFLGVNAVILPGVTVGERAYVGASAVVTKDEPPGAVVAGNPARVLRRS
jgi:carbonic anhydrase/acetyltransferase-like protein (isoleucine patch superfamily)